jgi:hypothetical protein
LRSARESAIVSTGDVEGERRRTWLTVTLVVTVALVALGGGFAAWRFLARAPGIAKEPPKELEPVPPELQALVKTIELPYAENVIELTDAADPNDRVPNVLVNASGIFLDGKRVGAVLPIVEAGKLTRVEGLWNELKAWRDAWKRAHPGEEFPGVAQLWIDSRTTALVVKSVFQTVTYATFPNVAFVVRARDAPSHLARINADARVPRPANPADARGTLPREVIERSVRAHYSRVRRCYEAGLARNPTLEGRVEIQFVIGEDGMVSMTKSTAATTLRDDEVVKCVQMEFHYIGFPKPTGGSVAVVYPVDLEPG